MAIITKPVGGIFKGTPAEIILNKSELALLPIVSSDDYFSVTSNWKKVILSYISSTGKQKEIVEFDATESIPTGIFDVSLKARNIFEIQVVKIVDFDGDIFIVPRDQLITSDFDVFFINPPSSLSYNTPVTYTQNQAITNNVPTVTGEVDSYSISPALPAGLSINPTTGVISGTSTEVISATNFTVTASNVAGSTTASISITIVIPAPTNLSYTTPVSYTQNTQITENTPTVTGTVTSYSVSPALPSGLNLNTSTGVISGTPLVAIASTSYTVTATNSSGFTTAIIDISVIDQFDYITYSFATTHVLNELGGVSGGDGTTIKTTEGKSNNFELNFLFNLNSHVFLPDGKVIFGAEQHDNFTTNSNPRFTGFILSNLASGLQVFNDGALAFSTTVGSIPAGDNFFKIIRNNGVLQFKLNSTVLHTVNTLSHLDIEMFATVAVRGNVELKQSYYSTIEENVYYFNNTYKAPNLLVTDGGKSLEVSYAQDYGTALISAPVHEFASKSYYFEFNVVSLAVGSQISFGYRKTAAIGPVIANLSSPTFYLGAHVSSGDAESRIYYQNSRMYFSNNVLAGSIPAFTISQGDNIGILRLPQSPRGYFSFRIVKNGTVVGTYTNTSGGSNRFEYFAVQLQTVGDKVTINETPVYTLPANTIYVKP